MKKYTVTRPIYHQGTFYEAGSIVEMLPKKAEYHGDALVEVELEPPVPSDE
jgi:hypothetical protein